MIIQIVNGVPVGQPQSDNVLHVKYPNTSFPTELTPPDVAPFGYGIYISVAAPTPGTYQKVVQATPMMQPDQCWYEVWEVVDMTPEEVEAKNASLRETNKNNASQLLSQTDWVELSDVDQPSNPPWLTNKAQFTAYRSQLRAIAVNPPIQVANWPVKPQEVWSET